MRKKLGSESSTILFAVCRTYLLGVASFCMYGPSRAQSTFELAARYERDAPNSCAVVLLDEVGLAEQSPHLPLKVLHKVLDESKGGSVVGISNWTLDPAKMNRAAHLYRPAPTEADLSATAEGMVRSASLKGYLQALARAYFQVYHRQSDWQHEDFWGLREFYSLIKVRDLRYCLTRVSINPS